MWKCHKVFDCEIRLKTEISLEMIFEVLSPFIFQDFSIWKLQTRVLCTARNMQSVSANLKPFIWKFKPKSWFCIFFSIRWHNNRPKMTWHRILPFTQDSLISQNFILNCKSSIPNLKIYLTKNMLREFCAYRTCNSKVIAHVLFLEHLQYIRF